MELRVCEHPLDADSTWTMPGAYPGNSQGPPPKEASEMKWLVKPAEI